MPKRNKVEIIITADDKASKKVAGVGNSMKKLGAVVASVAAAVGVVKLGKAFANLAIEAAPLKNIMIAFDGLTQTIEGGSRTMLRALQESSAGMIANRDLLRTFNSAASLVSIDFAQRLPEAMGAFQKVSAATGKSIDFLMNSYVTGIGRLQPLILDNLEIQVDLTKAYADYSDEIGVSVDALSKQQQQIALTNQTLELLAANTASMPDISQSAAAGLARFQATLQNTKDDIGLALNPALGNLMDILNRLAGQVLPVITNAFQSTIGPAIDIIIGKLGGLADTAAQTGQDFADKFGGKLIQTAQSALQWGINISTQLASGIIEGAASALTAAMRFVGSLLSSWLSPGSPPKVAPDINLWGAGTMNEYLKGFTEASFDILEGLQSPLQSALSALVKAGDIGQDLADKTFRSLSVELSKSIDMLQKTGSAGTEIFDKLRESGGRFGADLVELARRQFTLAKATREVRLAEENLLAARTKEEGAQGDLNRIMDEFNELRRSGASQGVLRAKALEFEAAKKSLRMAKDGVKEAEEQKKVAEKQVDPLQEQVSLQERLLNQMTQLTAKQEESADIAGSIGAAVAGAIGGALADLELPEIGGLGAGGIGEGIVGGLNEAFENAKEVIGEAMAGLFKPIEDEWQRLKDGPLADLTETWDWFKELIGEFWEDERVQGVIQFFEDLIPPELLGNMGKVAGTVLAIGAAFAIANIAIGIAAGLLGILTSPIVLLILLGGLLLTAWENNWFGIRDTTLEVIENIKTWIGETIETIEEWWEDHGGKIEEIWNGIKEFFDFFLGQISLVFDAWKAIFAGDWREFGETLREIWDNAWEKLKEIGENAWAAIKEFFGETDWGEVGRKILEGIAAGITGGLSLIKDAATSAASAALEAAKGFLGIDSPSKMFAGLGVNMMQGMAAGIAGATSLPVSASMRAADASFLAAGGDNRRGTFIENMPISISTRATTSTIAQDLTTVTALVGPN